MLTPNTLEALAIMSVLLLEGPVLGESDGGATMAEDRIHFAE